MAKSKYTVHVSGLKTVKAIEVVGPYLPVLSLSESRTYSNFLEFDRRTGVPVPEYTEMLNKALDYAQRHKYALRNPTLIAQAFLHGLEDAISEEEFAEACRLNAAETLHGICHSHDFCDANEVMDEAFKSVGIVVDPQSEVDAQLWNTAWEHAKARMIAQSKQG